MDLDACIDEVVGKDMHMMAVGKFRQRCFLFNILEELIQHCLLLLDRDILVCLTFAILLLLLSLVRVVLGRFLGSNSHRVSFVAQQKHNAFFQDLFILYFLQC